MMEGLNRTALALALMDLRRRFLEASPGGLRRHLADIILGEELAGRVYGPISG